jgi:hypothetical protein
MSVEEYWPNVILVSGTGRNVGKTTLCCRLIREWAAKQDVIAIKITSHQHPVKDNCFYRSEECVISEEFRTDTGKDTARMLESGAKRVFYVQTQYDTLKEAWSLLKQYLPRDTKLIIESAALRELIKPGKFIILTKSGGAKKNKHLLIHADLIIPDFQFSLLD